MKTYTQMNHRLRMAQVILPALLSLSLVACKSKTEAPQVQQEAAAVKAAPAHTVFAASAHVRVLDTARGEVVGRVQMQKAVRVVQFSADGRTAYVAASDGIRAIDRTTFEVVGKLTDNPTRYIELSPDGRQLFALEHFVLKKADGSPDPQPFSLLTIDTETGKVTHKEVVGERMIYARATSASAPHSVLIAESGRIVVGTKDTPWGEGTTIDPLQGLPPETPYRVRNSFAHFGDHVFVAIEGQVARVLHIDTVSGETRFLSLGGPSAVRGLGITPDGRTLVVNTGVSVAMIDVATAQLQGEPVDLPDGEVGCAVTDDGRFAYFAQTRDGMGGAVLAVDLEARQIVQKIHLDDISPWALAVAPRLKVATR